MPTTRTQSALMEASELFAHLGDTDWRIIDATYYLGKPVSDARQQFIQQHIPGAVFFDIDAIADTASPLPHMLPSAEQFADAMAQMGITPDHHIVVYDAQGMFSAPRVWWTLRHFGYTAVRVLNGGLPAWLASGYTTETGDSSAARSAMVANGSVDLSVKSDVVTAQQLLAHLDAPALAAIVDARAANRFNAEVDEPRPGLRRGHIPGSDNVPWDTVLDPETRKLLPADQLRQRFSAVLSRQADQPDKPVVCTCGSGMTACILALALHEMGIAPVAIYDGSWAEWGAQAEWPIAP